MPDQQPIPLVDLSLQHAPIARELEEAALGVIRSGAFVLGPALASFEAAYARWSGVEHVIGVASGTDAVLSRLHEAGIGAGIHYPDPIHRLGAFSDLGYASGDFPVAERAAREILTLPLYPGITATQQDRVVEALHQALIR